MTERKFNEIYEQLDQAKESSNEYHILEEILNIDQRNKLLSDMFKLIDSYGITSGEVDVSDTTCEEFPVKKLKWNLIIEAEE